MKNATTDFGYQKVSPEEKTLRVSQVFTSVASRYDLMNDLMSFGAHRLWKRYAVALAGIRAGARVLDVAGGTGDMAALFRSAVGDAGEVVVCDINPDMLGEGRDNLVNRGMCTGFSFVQADAQALPFVDNCFDCVSIAFGLRNVTDKMLALESMYGKLKFGSPVIILEFSRVVLPPLRRLYDFYSFNCIPVIGKLVARDEESYRYLVESIRVHPDQETLKSMMEKAGFSCVEYYNLSGGIVAVHKGYKI